VRPAVIVDTNVVVAGLPLSANALPVAAILREMLSGELSFIASPQLLAEYREVLGRPLLKALHGLAEDALQAFLDRIEERADVIAPAVSTPAPDPGDQMLWDLLAARADLVLVTGDKLLLRDRAMRGRVITPQVFLALDTLASSRRP
jgi:putative PIN family toxin of toxin-antitoxin system